MPNGNNNPYYTPVLGKGDNNVSSALQLLSLTKGANTPEDTTVGEVNQLGNPQGVDLQGGYQQTGEAPTVLGEQPQQMQEDIFDSDPLALSDIHGITKSIFG